MCVGLVISVNVWPFPLEHQTCMNLHRSQHEIALLAKLDQQTVQAILAEAEK
jgi:hypothetical protein